MATSCRQLWRFQVDFSSFDVAAREIVKEKVMSLDVGILINNVGLSYPYTKYLDCKTALERKLTH